MIISHNLLEGFIGVELPESSWRRRMRAVQGNGASAALEVQWIWFIKLFPSINKPDCRIDPSCVAFVPRMGKLLTCSHKFLFQTHAIYTKQSVCKAYIQKSVTPGPCEMNLHYLGKSSFCESAPQKVSLFLWLQDSTWKFNKRSF